MTRFRLWRLRHNTANARFMTLLELKSMERVTSELHQELAGLLAERKPRGFRLRRNGFHATIPRI
jgi:hypothetical protein